MNDTGIVRWMFNVRYVDWISPMELSTGLQLKTMWGCLQKNRLLLFVNLERIKASSWPSKSWKFGVGGSLAGRQPR